MRMQDAVASSRLAINIHLWVVDGIGKERTNWETGQSVAGSARRRPCMVGLCLHECTQGREAPWLHILITVVIGVALLDVLREGECSDPQRPWAKQRRRAYAGVKRRAGGGRQGHVEEESAAPPEKRRRRAGCNLPVSGLRLCGLCWRA